jgi:hypothetical protein
VLSGSAILRSRISVGRQLMAVSGFAVDADSGGCRCDVEVCSKTAFPGGHPEELLDDHNHVLHSVGVFGGGVFFTVLTHQSMVEKRGAVGTCMIP